MNRSRNELPQQAGALAAKKRAPDLTPPLADQFRRIIKEFNDEKTRASDAAEKGKTPFEKWKIRGELAPDETPYARRIVDLAAASPLDPASRDALIWVIDKRYRSDSGPFGDEVQRAVNLLVNHHANDPEVARLGLSLDNLITRRRDAFLEGIYANAEGREPKGLARMALAQYLERKAAEVASANKFKKRSIAQFQTYDEHGNLVEKTTRLSNEEESYRVHERLLDPEKVRLEAERLYEEVIALYGDIPYLTTRYRELERRARETPSSGCAPFTLLGVVTDGRAAEAKKVIDAEGMTWPNLLKGGDKVAEQYHVQSNPSYFVIDAGGIIRSKGLILPSSLDFLVETLVTEAESARTPKAAAK